jgi:murein DD-endopeptidase
MAHENRINEQHENDPAGSAMKTVVRLAGTLVLAVVCAQLFGCGTLPRKATLATSVHSNSPTVVVVQTARQQIGAPYRYGGSTPRGFDCSGLVHYAFLRAGIEVPRTTGGLLRRARRVPLSKLRPGDVLFFRIAPPKITHVGLYIGGGRFIHAPSSGKEVSYANLSDEYWKHHLVSAGRLY